MAYASRAREVEALAKAAAAIDAELEITNYATRGEMRAAIRQVLAQRLTEDDIVVLRAITRVKQSAWDAEICEAALAISERYPWAVKNRYTY